MRVICRSTPGSAEGQRMDTTALLAAALGAETGGPVTLALNRLVVTALPRRRLQWSARLP